ncbi:uncharacterized protein J7T54_000060 [Emericellopsis cladophorae]|uniref:Manganese/iron superoxide dismutase C-terminal domain-containing protein n=1 Tax=Emericellopsis cladophorae TaxID=2686198 RepID=A0A9Q0BDG5_9HYPO|nr:uncharacterized protein J7T54_000060 [Emericellopsis cladophorae]KAI6780154.1 hypothetical protein J7T54_000060 [Emericellopsis cladophorae]
MIRPRLRSLGFGAPTVASKSIVSSVCSRRSFHSVPKLRHDYAETGVPNLMSPAGFSIAWTDYMTLVTEKLNELTAGTELEGKDAKSVSLMTAREPGKAREFNWASMAHNNHFFFDGITPNPTPISEPMKKELEACFSSMETLRREFVLTANSMFGPGFVWLVQAGAGTYRLLPTYLAGSPYPGAHWRAQSQDMNTLGNRGTATSYLRNTAFGGRAQSAKKDDLPPGGIDVTPLLCLNTWEHTWLLDWGVGKGGAGGKLAYAESWWEMIDWQHVEQKAQLTRPAFR